jgi:hypothetical protein
LDKPSAYADFAARVERHKGSLSGLLHLLKRRGKTIAAYGASAKGSTLLNYCQIGRDVLDFVVDRSSVKRGRYMPGVRLPIHAPEALMDRKPDVVLMLTWNFADEILRQQHQYRESGGSFLLPIPEPVLV